jgi:hypothetical protein
MDLTNTQLIAIVVLLLIAAGVVVYLVQRRRSERLRARFGPEYERAVAEGGDRRQAEARLAERAKRVHGYHLRPLAAADRANFLDAWTRVQAEFVDNPASAVAEADGLLGQVMVARGYPMTDFEQRAADISVDHPGVVQNYRTAHAIAVGHARGDAGTEDLREAMIHYRALFEELVTEPAAASTKDVAPDASAARGRRPRDYAARAIAPGIAAPPLRPNARRKGGQGA